VFDTGARRIAATQAAHASPDKNQSVATVNLSVFRRHPCGVSALGSACKSG